ncbi:BnaC06g29960D [Brassica napus]|uniref:BnaC06g29960D protein n=1 Tax=Brassica napus TaxID=3708 RepID=A0A078H6S7_BRANA|nr:BnaC06g29960D [Brassica napus]
MGEQRQLRSRFCNRMQTKRCSANGIMNEFIVVDDDEVIILDFPESSKKGKAPETSRARDEPVLPRVISIDDDDEDEDTENVHKDGSSSSRMHTSVEVDDGDDDDCQFVQEKCASFRFTKCNQATMPSSGTRFGLDSESESEFSESDCSDCEILEGSQGEVREQWEKAFLEKMKKAGKAGLSEEAGPSNLRCDTNFRPGFESRNEQHDQTSSFFTARNAHRGKAGLSEEAGPSNFRPGCESGTDQHDQTASFFSAKNFDGCKGTYSTFFGTEKSDKTATSFFTARNPDGRKETSSTFFGTDNRNPKTSLFAEPSSLSPGIQVEHERSKSPTSDSTSSKEQRKQNSVKEAEKQPDTEPVQCETSKKGSEENQKRKAAEHSYTKEVVQEEDASKWSPPHTSDGDGETPPVLGVSNGARCEGGIGESRETIIDPIPSTSEPVQSLQGTAPEIDVMLNREMLKETDEYKKAQEEEWESRQRQLQLQAEEAQRQRKRRKLANTRQLEMERRQKERVEEVRETQKKEEESMNMKEKVRAEITKTLKVLELGCFNMAALLRGLGIPVKGGISPPPQEVHAAYKRAVLKFHPDRASGGDIKQQVEAEETFKLIARMKDKFLS